MTKHWEIDKARKEAQTANKLLTMEYDAIMDADFYSAMTLKEFEAAKNTRYNKPICGWIIVKEDYTTKIA